MKHNTQNIFELLKEGVVFGKNGHYTEAKNRFNKVIELDSKNSKARFNLGLLQYAAGKIQESFEILKSAIEINNLDVTYWTTFLNLLAANDRNVELEIALQWAKTAGASDPKINDAIKPIIKLVKSGDNPSNTILKKILFSSDIEPTETKMQNCLILLYKYPKSAILKNLYGCFLSQTGNKSLAIEFYKQAVELAPLSFEYSLNLALAQISALDLRSALQTFSKLEEKHPFCAEIAFNIGKIHFKLDRFDSAFLKFQKCINLDATTYKANMYLGLAAQKLGRLEYAHKALNTELKNDMKSVDNLINYGGILIELGRYKEAKLHFLAAIKIDRKSPQLHNNLGVIALAEGHSASAIQYFEKALKLDPKYSEAFLHLTLSKILTPRNKIVKHAIARVECNNLPLSDNCNLCFGLGNVFDKTSDHESAFNYYFKANQIKRLLAPYDIKEDIDFFHRIKSYMTSLNIQVRDNHFKNVSFSPMFIVGMPRSGTTLIEQILASHSMIETAGELNSLAQFCRNAIIGNRQLGADSVSKFLETYKKSLSTQNTNSKYIIDKLPGNFKYLGLIFKFFPDAKVIHTVRSKEAVCWSNFKQAFNSSGNRFTNSLHDIDIYHSLYRDLMGFWSENFSYEIYDVDYDKFTSDPYSVVSRLLTFLNVPFEDNCLLFNQRDTFIATASQVQVRGPIYKGSSNEWKKYKSFLTKYIT